MGSEKEDEIDLIELIKTIWSQRILLVKIIACFLLFGLLIAFTSKVEYKAFCRLLPEVQGGGADFGGLGGLAGLAGIDVSGFGESGVLSPELYPEIVNSAPFLDRVINTPVFFEKKDTIISSFDYFKKIDRPSFFDLIAEYTIGLPSKIMGRSNEVVLEDYDLMRFSKEEWEIIEEYRGRLSVSVDSNTGTISVSAEMPDPVAAAMLADLLVKELTQSVVNYKVEKSQVNLEFIMERFEEAKNGYEAKQDQLARFTDQNRNISNSIITTEYERLQNELNISFEVYKSLATQLEQAKIKVKEDTPVFTVLEPVRVPEEKVKPKRVILIITFIVIGAFVGIFTISFKSWLSKFHQ